MDLGIVINESNQAIGIYQRPGKIAIRSKNRTRFSLDVTLNNSKLRIKARTSAETIGYENATNAFFNVTEITSSGYYEISTPTGAWDLELEHETTDAVNTTKVAMSVQR